MLIHLNDQGIPHLLVSKGVPWDPTLRRKPLSQLNLVMYTTLYIYTLKGNKFKQKMIYRFKMAAKLQIFASPHFNFGENKKNKQTNKQKAKKHVSDWYCVHF